MKSTICSSRSNRNVRIRRENENSSPLLLHILFGHLFAYNFNILAKKTKKKWTTTLSILCGRANAFIFIWLIAQRVRAHIINDYIYTNSEIIIFMKRLFESSTNPLSLTLTMCQHGSMLHSLQSLRKYIYYF